MLTGGHTTLTAPGNKLAVSAAQIVEQLEAHGVEVTPTAFEVWHAHRRGADPALSRAISDRLADGGKIDAAFLNLLHGCHLTDISNQRLAERSSKAVMMEIDGIVELVRMSLGASNKYGDTLSSMLADIVKTDDPTALKHIVQGLVRATEEVQTANNGLESRLTASRREIDELRHTLEATRLETLQDALTGISNRKHFEQAIQKALQALHDQRRPFCLLMLDIDFFKHFNDKHGHLLGDKVLKVVAQALREKFSSNATVARYGGEEFAIIIEGADLMAGWIGAEAARQTILARELVKRSTGEKLGRITVSIGVAACSRADTRETVVARADAALMRAKAAGRNRTITEDQLNGSAVA
jgi:diguanylate cyclase